MAVCTAVLCVLADIPGLEQGLERTLAVETTWDMLSFMCACACVYLCLITDSQTSDVGKCSFLSPSCQSFFPEVLKSLHAPFGHECSCVPVGFIREVVCFLF